MDSTRNLISSRTHPHCPSCKRTCKPGATWAGANYCRGIILLDFIQDNPGLSAWELSQASGVPYTDATRGLNKLREYGVVNTVSEDKGDGKFRYRYWCSGDPDARQRFMNALQRAEGLN